MEVVSKWLPFTIDGITHKKHILTSKPINFAALTDLSCVICSIFIALLIAAVITHLHEDVSLFVLRCNMLCYVILCFALRIPLSRKG